MSTEDMLMEFAGHFLVEYVNEETGEFYDLEMDTRGRKNLFA